MRLKRETASFGGSCEILDAAQPPCRVAAPEVGVERQVARRRLEVVFEPRTIEDQRRSSSEQAVSAVEQSECRLPPADVHHVDAQDRIGALDRPISCCSIKR